MTHIEIEWHGRIAVLTFGSGARKNALGSAFWEALPASLDAVLARPDARALILVGRGENFSSGVDLNPSDPFVMALGKAMSEDPKSVNEPLDRVNAVLDRLASAPLPTIAAIEGYCVGGGLELALACDLRVCSDGARVGFSELQRGLTPNLGGIGRLCAAIGPGRAKALLLTGRLVGGGELVALGLADHMAKSGESLAEALTLARAIERSGPEAVRQTLSVVRAASAVPGFVREAERAAALRVLSSGEPLAGIAAFLQKAPPPWTS